MAQFIQLETMYRFAKSWYLVLLLYALLIGIGLFYHEPWRDETHTWLIVHQSHSLLDLFQNIRYEGHPILWYLLLYAIKSVNGSFAMVQVVHWSIAVGSAYLLLTYAPFAYPIRVMIAFSYFFVYEYAIIARNYAPGLLLLLLICTLFHRRYQFTGHLIICGLLFLLFQTNVFAVLTGLTLYGVMLLEVIAYQRSMLRTHWQQYLLGMGIVGVGLLVCLLTVLTPTDAGFPHEVHGGWTHWNITLCFEMIWNAFVPLPARLPNFWNSNVLEMLTNIKLRTVLRAGLSAVLLGVVMIPLFRSRLALLGWSLVCAGMLFFMISQYFGQLRHHGHFVASGLVFLWVQPLLADYQATRSAIAFNLITPLANRLVLAVLVLQVLAGALSYITDLRHPFSGNQPVAAYIESGSMRNWFRMGDPDYSAEGIAAGLPENRMYYPSNGQYGGFLRWNNKRQLRTLSQIMDSARQVNQSPTLLILNQPITPDTAQLFHLTLIKRFTNNIQFDENYYLYRYNRRP